MKNAAAIKTATLPNASRRYAVVDRATGEHVATVYAGSFSHIGLSWIPETLGVGEYLIFRPFEGGAPDPIAVSVTSANGKWRAQERLSEWQDRKLAPAGFRAMLNASGQWVAATTALVEMLVSRGYMQPSAEDKALEWAAGNEGVTS